MTTAHFKILSYPVDLTKAHYLTTPTIEVESLTKSIHLCIQNMHGILGKIEYGVALAANQVSEKYRIFVYKEDLSTMRTVINPKIIFGEKYQYAMEGCLSFPGAWLPIKRHKHINVRYVDFPSMEERSEDFSDFTARIFQHETEHLDGHVFIDNLPSQERDEFLSKAARDNRSSKNRRR